MIDFFQPIKHMVYKWVGSGIIFLLISTMHSSIRAQEIRSVRVGIFTDCQYCNCPAGSVRYYNLSLSKLDSCIGVFNSLSLNAVFHLGDMIDHDFSSYDSVLLRFQHFLAPLHLVLGNHDYMIKKKFKAGLLDRIGMKEDHYIVDLGKWRFIVLNGDELSFFAPQDKQQKEERDNVVYDQFEHLNLNGMIWNGGIGSVQMSWLETQLNEAEQKQMNVIVVCHFPLFTKDNHNLFNNKELFHMISRYPSVKAYFNGHYHSGSYMMKEGIHLVNFKGMVDTKINAFSVVTLTSDSILIKGYGREPDRNLKIRVSLPKSVRH
jgi:manganese-dependent ADP-ribose/CDP-alcohol diphosphatase